MEKKIFPSEPKKWNYATPDMIVFGKDDFEAQISAVVETARGAGDGRPIEVILQCQQHQNGGVIAVYEDGLIVLGCKICGTRIGQVEVAERSRRWGRLYKQ